MGQATFADMVIGWTTATDFSYAPTPLTITAAPLVNPTAVLVKASMKGCSVNTDVTTAIVPTKVVTVADWDVGWIQILGVHTMDAKWKKGNKTRSAKWRQSALPCYDSDQAASIPWYNHTFAAPRALSTAAPVRVHIEDAPAMSVYSRFGDNAFPVKTRDRHGVTTTVWVSPFNNQDPDARVAEISKKLSFEMYLAVIKTRNRGVLSWKTSGCMRILQKITWSTTIVIERNATTRKLETTTNEIVQGNTTDYESDESAPALTVLPGNSLLNANDSIVVTRV